MAAVSHEAEKTFSKVKHLFPDVVVLDIPRPENHALYRYNGFQPGRQVLKPGHVKSSGSRAFGVATIYERDQTITVRDGARLYGDIFRPETSESESQKVPCILPWNPYGKTGTSPQTLDNMAPFRAGVANSQVSGYQSFEAPDPAEWAERGYALANVDARGAGNSDGIISFWGAQDAEDIYDVIEWISQQPWSNGSVVMAGNSWLAATQINFVSRLRHPCLKAVAPWEGLSDPYRQIVARGGRIHIPKFNRLIGGGFAGPEGAESIIDMVSKRPLYDDYWEAKRIPVENINYDIPMYIVGSYSSMLHTYGSFQTYRLAATRKKWLRVHNTQEWYDFYRPHVMDELQAFFDFYSKPHSESTKDWESSTPKVRMSLLGFEASGGQAKTVVERVEDSFPLERQELRALYLDARDGSLGKTLSPEASSKGYEGRSLDDCLTFTAHFDEPTELAGYPLAVLHVSCPDHDDMCIAVQIRKIDASGNQLVHLNYPCPVPLDQVPDVNVAKYLGPQGFLRASHHVSKNGRGGPPEPQGLAGKTNILYSHREREPIKPGEIVRLEIPLWPMGMTFAAGEGITLKISGHDMCLPETDICQLTEPEDDNVGRHIVHAGGEFDSHLIIPVIKV